MSLVNNAARAPITTLIPHREPMVMVDRVIALDGLRTQTSFLVKADGLFVSGNEFSEMGMLENIAQTSFIFLNHFFADQAHLMWSEGRETLGFISTVTSATVLLLPRVGQTLETTTTTELVFTSDLLKICNIDGDIRIDGQLAMRTRMKMLLQTREKP